MLWSVIAETYERKWQIVAAAAGTAIFGLLFATRTGPMGVAVLGILITNDQPAGLFLTRISG